MYVMLRLLRLQDVFKHPYQCKPQKSVSILCLFCAPPNLVTPCCIMLFIDFHQIQTRLMLFTMSLEGFIYIYVFIH